MANSAVSAVATLLIAAPVAIGLGVYAGLRQGKLPDRIIAVVTLIGTSLPEFVWKPSIIVFSYKLEWLPPSSLMDPGDPLLTHVKVLVMPVLTLTLVMLAYTSRMTRRA